MRILETKDGCGECGAEGQEIVPGGPVIGRERDNLPAGGKAKGQGGRYRVLDADHGRARRPAKVCMVALVKRNGLPGFRQEVERSLTIRVGTAAAMIRGGRVHAAVRLNADRYGVEPAQEQIRHQEQVDADSPARPRRCPLSPHRPGTVRPPDAPASSTFTGSRRIRHSVLCCAVPYRAALCRIRFVPCRHPSVNQSQRRRPQRSGKGWVAERDPTPAAAPSSAWPGIPAPRSCGSRPERLERHG